MNTPSVLSEARQARLDVIEKSRANPFNWRGQFTPQLVEYFLEEFGHQSCVVADPFSGSGTVLLESAKKGFPCYGLEINPAAYAMSKFYTLSNRERCARVEILEAVKTQLMKSIQPIRHLPLCDRTGDYRTQKKNLIDFTGEYIPELRCGIEKIVALNMLFVCESRKDGDLGASLLASFEYIKNTALSLPYTNSQVSTFLCDARLMHNAAQVRANIIITSPPYINVFNYHQNYRAILEAVGWDLLKVAPSEFGANRKNRGNRFKTVIQYCLDMEQALKSFWQSLVDGGLLILIIGRESSVRGTPFYNGKIVQDIVETMRSFDAVSRFERKFVNKFNLTIWEDILILRKRGEVPVASDTRRIATKHLSSAFSLAPPNVQKDIAAAIMDCTDVLPSPLFSVKGAYSIG